MSFSVALDVFIGLMLMYLVLSLLCTTVVEIVLTLGSFRARHLSAALDALIDDPRILARFYNDGLIATAKRASRGGDAPVGQAGDDKVEQGRGERIGRAVANAWSSVQRAFLPSGGDTRAFDARIKEAAKRRPKHPAPENTAPENEAYPSGRPRDREHPSYLDSAIVAHAIQNSLKADLSAKGSVDPTSLKVAIEKLPSDSKLRSVLLSAYESASGDVVAFRANVAHWFDKSMDRLSGDFGRLSKYWSLLVGLAIASILNADSIAVGTALWSSPALREQSVSAAVSATANEYIDATACKAPEQAGGPTPAVTQQPAGASRPQTAAGAPAAKTETKPETKPEPDPQRRLSCQVDQLRKLQAELAPFPIGWSAAEASNLTPWTALLEVFGIVWTGLALSLGAPFWFDLLQRAINLRGSGPKPTTQAEKDSRTN